MPVPPRPTPPKKDVALALLEGDSVFIHLDPRRDGVLVPKQFAKQSQLVLQVGLRLAIRIPDLLIDDEGISCTLSFNRAPFWCRMPWEAIYALVGPDGRGQLWPDDVPPEVAAQMRAGRTKGAAKRPRPRLSAVRADDGATTDPGEGDEVASDPQEDAAEGKPSESKRPPADPGETGARPPSKRPRPRAVPTTPPTLATVPRRPVGVPSPRIADDPPPRGAHVKPPPPRTAPTRPVAPATGAGSSDGGKRPKRELPPYLRVVK